MSPPLSAVVVGCGRVGSGYDDRRRGKPPLTHAGSYAGHPRIELIAGVDHDPAARKRFADRWGVASYENVEPCLELGPDLVSIATPPGGRLELVERILTRPPRAIWIEKPLAATAQEGARIVEVCRRAGVPLQVNFERRFDPLHARVVETLRADPGPLHANFCFSGTLENFGSHALDLFRWLAGDPIEIHTIPLPDRDPAVLLVTADGSTGSFMQVQTADTVVFDLDVLTAARRITLGALGAEMVEAPAAMSRVVEGIKLHHIGSEVDRSGVVNAMAAGADDLVRHLEHGGALRCDGDDGLAALRLQEAIVSSTQQLTAGAVS